MGCPVSCLLSGSACRMSGTFLPPSSTVLCGSLSIGFWFLDAALDMESYTAPPMAEGLAAYDGKLLILFESGADYYKDDGGVNPTDRVWVME